MKTKTPIARQEGFVIFRGTAEAAMDDWDLQAAEALEVLTSSSLTQILIFPHQYLEGTSCHHQSQATNFS